MTLDDQGVRPLTMRERRALAHLEQTLTGGLPAGSTGCTDGSGTGSGAGRATGGDPAPRDPEPAGLHRADRIAAVVGLLILCGLTAEAAIAGGPILALGVGVAFLCMVLAFVGIVCHGR
jgi:hypothetical protein